MMLITKLQIGQEAPDFRAESTKGPISLGQYRGNWVVLFSYAKDDTSVCTAQCLSFADHQEAFKTLGVQLLGLSVDSVESHEKWVAKLEQEKGAMLDFPLIADQDKRVSRLYGVLDEDKGVALRGVFVIDPAGKLRFMACYPLRVAPNVDEAFRVVRELKELKDVW
ncbi:MAG: redoxin domain-containing protein [Chloroflexi bacterium]|nr:redoxin domain-containing protein [Chloroflexota bacterium]